MWDQPPPRYQQLMAVPLVILVALATSVTASSTTPTSLAVFQFAGKTQEQGTRETRESGAQKRQIFREQVSPHTGGKIPEDAFRADRLALNKLNGAGISVPDGVLVHARDPARHQPTHPSGPHAHDPHSTLIKIVHTPDGRYVPQEGASHQQNTVDSTYLLRTPAGWSQHASQLVGLHKALGAPLQLPGSEPLPQLRGKPVNRRPFEHKYNPTEQGVSSRHNINHQSHHNQPPSNPPPHQQSLQTHQNNHHVPEPAPFPSIALQPPPNVPPLIHHSMNQPQNLHLRNNNNHHRVHHQPQNHQQVKHTVTIEQSIPLEPVTLTPAHDPPPQEHSHPPPNHIPATHVHPTSHQSINNHPTLHHVPSLHTVHTPPHESLQSSEPFSLFPEHLADISSDRDPTSAFLQTSIQEAAFLRPHDHLSSILDDHPSFLLEDWELPVGLLSTDHLTTLYGSDHDDKLQHLHTLSSF